MGITQHGPTNPTIHHPRDSEAEQRGQAVCGGIPGRPMRASQERTLGGKLGYESKVLQLLL